MISHNAFSMNSSVRSCATTHYIDRSNEKVKERIFSRDIGRSHHTCHCPSEEWGILDTENLLQHNKIVHKEDFFICITLLLDTASVPLL